MTKLHEINVNSYGSKMTIIEYNGVRDITVEFENGYKTKNNYSNFKKGGINNPYDKTVYNIGYIGEGNYKTKIKGSHTIQYLYWFEMLKRCYKEKELKKHPTYKDCEVCEEWHCFQTFAKWFDEHYYEVENERMELDKDILYNRNKVYSPNTCVFVPKRINQLFTKRQNYRGEYPIGVNILPNGRFRARCNILESRKDLGCYDTPEQAFYDGYKPFKEAYIKEIANDYKNTIPIELYDAMINYVVEIDD